MANATQVVRAVATASLVVSTSGHQSDLAPSAPHFDQGMITGQVLEAGTEAPISGVAVRVEETGHVGVTDETGEFEFEEVDPGTYTVSFSHLGYEEHQEQVILREGVEFVELRVRLASSPIEIEGLDVPGGIEPPEFGTLSPVYERMRRMEQLGLGHFVTRDEIEEWYPTGRPSEILRNVPGITVHSGRPPGWEVRRARGSRTAESCPGPTVYLDDVRIMRPGNWGEGMHPDHLVGAGELDAVEVYRSPAELPAAYSGPDAQCGVVLLWTRRGR